MSGSANPNDPPSSGSQAPRVEHREQKPLGHLMRVERSMAASSKCWVKTMRVEGRKKAAIRTPELLLLNSALLVCHELYSTAMSIELKPPLAVSITAQLSPRPRTMVPL